MNGRILTLIVTLSLLAGPGALYICQLAGICGVPTVLEQVEYNYSGTDQDHKETRKK